MSMATPEIELVLDAQVDTPGPQAPTPGHSHAISVTRYRVVRVLQGRYQHPFALVGHDGADMASPEFRPGVRKRIELTLKFPRHTTQLNPFTRENPGIPVYYCVTSRLISQAPMPRSY
jgi:hypothetical protein